jgi:hypothetical protein
MSYAINMPPTYTMSVDCIFIFKDENIVNRKKIFDLYCKYEFETFEEFDIIMTRYTSELYQCLVVCLCAPCEKKCIYWYKAG